jgi:hypothetical protein
MQTNSYKKVDEYIVMKKRDKLGHSGAMVLLKQAASVLAKEN